jgi:hypothetical protein
MSYSPCSQCRTIATSVKVHNIAYSDIHHAQKALILLFELLLVKYLYRQHTILGDFAVLNY